MCNIDALKDFERHDQGRLSCSASATDADETPSVSRSAVGLFLCITLLMNSMLPVSTKLEKGRFTFLPIRPDSVEIC